jgi:7-cyano-7-deazaguanine synthase
MKSVVLLSSGLDSAVAFKKAYDEPGVDMAITFDYGQRAAKKEIERAKKICERFNVRHTVIELPWLEDVTLTSLVNRGEPVPEPEEKELDDIKGRALATAHQVWVPNRNGVFINIAGSFADALGFDRIICGFNAEEGATFPDNTPEFVDAANKSLSYSCEKNVIVYAPLIKMNKVEIIKEGLRINAPIDLSWSCYHSYEKPCGKCESCRRRARAFRLAGADDPVRGVDKR